MPQPARISFVSSDAQLAFHLQLRLQSKGYQVAGMSCVEGVLGAVYSDPPDLLIIDLHSDFEACTDLIITLRSDSFFSAIPIIGLIERTDCDTYDWETSLLDDFVQLPLNFSDLFCRISLSLSRIKRIFDNNPLSRLPGNTSIHHAIEDAIGKGVAVCYLDINHFKPYNDVYGFSHGDEVIRMLSRIMFNAVRDSGGGFCGHIGGDDFVFILPCERAEAVCQTIIGYFDRIVLDLFDEETKRQGYYVGSNRKGEREQIPLLSISIAVIPMETSKIRHVAKVAELAADLKKVAKDSIGSRYVVDQRKG
ncbi:MAG: diguanylate cyclase [Deltaproteobacteria bacterium]|nr:diguanylate cyclase [Deltaproteobacteria bacterium]